MKVWAEIHLKWLVRRLSLRWLKEDDWGDIWVDATEKEVTEKVVIEEVSDRGGSDWEASEWEDWQGEDF